MVTNGKDRSMTRILSGFFAATSTVACGYAMNNSGPEMWLPFLMWYLSAMGLILSLYGAKRIVDKKLNGRA